MPKKDLNHYCSPVTDRRTNCEKWSVRRPFSHCCSSRCL